MRRAVGMAVVLGGIGLGVWSIAQQRALESEEADLARSSEPIFPSRDEIWQRTMARFDEDGDLQLSRQEFVRYQTHTLRFEDFDQSGDGFISVSELDTEIMRREPRPLMDLKAPHDNHPMLVPDRPVDQRPGRIP